MKTALSGAAFSFTENFYKCLLFGTHQYCYKIAFVLYSNTNIENPNGGNLFRTNAYLSAQPKRESKVQSVKGLPPRGRAGIL